MTGRPTDCTPEMIERVENALRELGIARLACVTCGLSETAYYTWLRRAAQGEEPFVQFAAAVERARAEFEAKALRDILAAADPQVREVVDKNGDVHAVREPGDWRARMEVLRIVNPRFNTKSRIGDALTLLDMFRASGVVFDEEHVIAFLASAVSVDEDTLRIKARRAPEAEGEEVDAAARYFDDLRKIKDRNGKA